MNETEILSIGQDLHGTLAVASAHRMLVNAKAATSEFDSIAGIVMAHCALESLLRRCALELERRGVLERPPDLKTNTEDLGLPGYLRTACAGFFSPSEQSDLRDCNAARNHAYHKSLPQDLGVVMRLVELTDSLGRKLGLWSEDKVEAPKPALQPASEDTSTVVGSMSAKGAILKVLEDNGEMGASALYDEAQRYYAGDRRALMAARWRLETEDDAIRFVYTRGVYKLRTGVSTKRKPSRAPAGGLTGREAILRALANNDGELDAGGLYDVAEMMCDCKRNSLAGIRSAMEEDGLMMFISTRGTYKLTRAGRKELEYYQ